MTQAQAQAQPKLTLTEFFNTDYVDYSSYDNLRKIASVVDGQKNGARKVLHTILEQNIKTPQKVSQISSRCAEFCVTGDTLVHTVEYGLIRIEDIVNSNDPKFEKYQVYSIDESGNSVIGTAKHTRFMKNTDVLIEIQTETDVIKCTPNHKILVKHNDGSTWKEAQHLTELDEIICV